MRRQQAVSDGEASENRQTGENRRAAGALRRVDDHRHQQDQADLKKYWHANQDAERRAAPRACLRRRIARPEGCPTQLLHPELERSCPRIAPMPRMMAMWPIISPAPAVKAAGTRSRGIPAAIPSAKAATERPRAACSRRRPTRSRRRATVPATQARRYPSKYAEGSVCGGSHAAIIAARHRQNSREMDMTET